MSTPTKDVIYIDVDDEITGIIDKVRGSAHRIVALVLPKRAAVLQSIVNMKLLKRTADESKKKIVLITSEAGLMPLAGAAGFYVAKSLQSKPEIPDHPASSHHHDEAETLDEDEGDIPLDDTKPIGELAGPAGDDEDEPIELDNDTPAAAAVATKGKKTKPIKSPKGKNKKLKVPNFEKFRLVIAIGAAGLVALIAVAIVCIIVLPKATILVNTDSTNVRTNVDITLATDATAVKLDPPIVPAQSQETKKELTQQADATGQQNNGQKASGTMKFYNCSTSDVTTGTERIIPKGTGVAANGLTYITSEDVAVEPSHFKLDGTCKKDQPSDSIAVMAQKGGASYNQDANTYNVAGYSSISGAGSAMTGGTDQIVKIVTQADIEGAKQKLGSQDTTAVKQELQSALSGRSLIAIPATFNTATPEVTTDVQAGATADHVTVKESVSYTMLGAKRDDLRQIIVANVNKQIDPKKQKILDDGLDKATFNMENHQGGSGMLVTLQAVSIAGSDLNIDSLKQQVAGKKAADAQAIIKAYPGVTDVSVKYSPFWVSSIPKKTNKITITIEKPKVTKNANP